MQSLSHIDARHLTARGLLPAGRGAAAARGTGTGRCRACTPLANAASLPFPSLATLLYAIRIVTVPCLIINTAKSCLKHPGMRSLGQRHLQMTCMDVTCTASSCLASYIPTGRGIVNCCTFACGAHVLETRGILYGASMYFIQLQGKGNCQGQG